MPLNTITPSFNEVQRFMLASGPHFMANFVGANAGTPIDKRACQDIGANALTVANLYRQHRDMLISMFNTNTIDSSLQRVMIMQEMVEDFAVIMAPLQNFSTVFQSVPLEGTDEVVVPFYDLDASSSQSWNPATGYATIGNTVTTFRKVAVGGSGEDSGSSAAANTAKDRKYIGLSFSSYEKNRQPYLNVSQLAKLKANKLAVDVFSDIVSRVITAASYGAGMLATAGFCSDDVADLYGTATGLNWPIIGRSLTLDHTLATTLLKDEAFKNASAYGSTDPLRRAAIRQAFGFDDIRIVPNLTTYGKAGENLNGWMCHQSAALVATAPILPTEEVRALLARYDIVVHPGLGIALEYRRSGNTTLDTSTETIECSYGAQKGNVSALRRLVSS